MKVYIVEHGEVAQGGNVLGVFATFKLAKKNAKGIPYHFKGGWKEESYSEIMETAEWENESDYVHIYPMRVVGIR